MKSKITQFIEYALARFIFFLVNLMPRKMALGFGRFLGRIIYKIKSLRKTIVNGLTIAFGDELSEKEILDLTKKSSIHWGMSVVEFMILPKIYKKNLIDKIVKYEQVYELSKKLLEKGKGLIFATGHFGMWEYMCGAVAKSGIPVSVIMRPLDNKILDKYVSSIRGRFGTKNVPKKNVLKMFKTIKNNEALVFMVDQNTIENYVFIPFFNVLAATSTGAAFFMNKFKDTPVIAVFSYRDENYNHICFGEEIKVIQSDDYDDFIRKNMANLTLKIEKYIREHPEQWLWFHPRWNKKPTPEEKLKYNQLAQEDLKEIN